MAGKDGSIESILRCGKNSYMQAIGNTTVAADGCQKMKKGSAR
jgi:hypothetical protein